MAALEGYENELTAILSRFREDRSGIHIDGKDEPRYRQIGQELVDLLRDEFVEGRSYANNVAYLLNNSVSNYTGMPSKHGVQTVKSAVASAITRLKRNPNVLKSGAKSNADLTSGSDARQILERIAERLHVVANQLRRRHGQRPTLEVGDEYDLQDLAHSLLRLFFDDIRPEEWAPSYAGASSRMDFLLAAEQIVVELKMMRPSLSTKQLGDELIVDIAKYQSHPGCKALICIVYDPDHRVNNPRGVERDLSKHHSQLDVSVMVVPR